MAWKLLPTDYTDAVWSGLKRYQEINNDDGTVSFEDVTEYTNWENSFFGAKDANKMNEALNVLMSMVENGTDLYEDFKNYFSRQRVAFEEKSDETYAELDEEQKRLFNEWFESLKTQLSGDVAGNLQNQIDTLDRKTDGFDVKTTTFAEDGRSLEEVYGNKKVITEFALDGTIVQRLYMNDVLALTKTVTFGNDGLSVNEEVK